MLMNGEYPTEKEEEEEEDVLSLRVLECD